MSAMLRLLPRAALAAVLLAGCGGDDDPIADAAPPAPDREDLCPGRLTLEALVADLVTGAAVFDVSLTEVGNEGNAATSAPNGRAILCLPAGEDSEVRATHPERLDRLDRVDADAAAIWYGASQPYPLHVVTPAAADALLGEHGLTRDEDAAQVIVTVLEYPGGTPLSGATVAIDRAHEGALSRDEEGGFAASDEIGAGGLVLFANAVTTGGAVTATVTPPDGYAGTCTGPSAAPLEAGAVTGLHIACH